MFGKEYGGHLDILIQSFGQINQQYKRKIKKDNIFTEKLKNLYVLLFGIPEIGFQIRSMYVKRFLISYLANKNFNKILDAGSGIGAYTILLAKNFPEAKVTAIDIDKNKLKSSADIANELKIENVEFLYLNITKLQDRPVYDFIINVDVLEHLNDYEEVLRNFFKLLKKDGYLYIHVPQPNQKRIFSFFKTWHHEEHMREGIVKTDLENALKQLTFKIVESKETFGFFGKLAWELNHLTLSKSFVLTGITFPFLFALASFDLFFKNKDGLGIAILAQKN